MPNIKSAKKRVLVAERNRERNIAIKSEVRTIVKKTMEAAINNDAEAAKELLNSAYKALDKAAQKKVLHKNNAARKKSRLTRFVNKKLSA